VIEPATKTTTDPAPGGLKIAAEISTPDRLYTSEILTAGMTADQIASARRIQQRAIQKCLAKLRRHGGTVLNIKPPRRRHQTF
jgi:hypothetical protein